MIQTVIRSWWLLALRGGLDLWMAAIYLVMQDRDGSLVPRTYALQSTVVLLGQLALAAGLCSLTAALWRPARRWRWPMAADGAAMAGLGMLLCGIFGHAVAFRSIAGLIAVSALCSGLVLGLAAREAWNRNHLGWGFGATGLASMGLGLLFPSMQPVPGTHSEILWVGGYLAFHAVCLLGLAYSGWTEDSAREQVLPGLPEPRPSQ